MSQLPFRHFILLSSALLLAGVGATLAMEVNQYHNFERFSNQYGSISTIAGTGEDRQKYLNNWHSEFEGKPAIQVELSRPHHAIADYQGNVIIADKDAHGIRRIDEQGQITTLAGTSQCADGGDQPAPAQQVALCFPNGIWVQRSGAVDILDTGNNKVRRVLPNGQISTLFHDPSGIETGRGLWVSSDATLAYYASGSELKRWTPEAGVEVIASGFKELANLALNDKNQLYVTDRNGHKVYRVDAKGNKTVVAGNGKIRGGGHGYPALETGLNEVRGIWFHPNGGYFLATHKGGQIWFVDPSGIIHLFIDGGRDHQHSGDGLPFNAVGEKISEPRAISLDHLGNLYITENDYGYIRKVSPR